MSQQVQQSHVIDLGVFRALGVAILAGVVAGLGVFFHWFMRLDGSWESANEENANFLIGAGVVVGTVALLKVAYGLMTVGFVPDEDRTSTGDGSTSEPA